MWTRGPSNTGSAGGGTPVFGRVLESQFIDQSNVVEFNEVSPATVNPTISMGASLSMSSSDLFNGQTRVVNTLTGSPSNPLTLNVDDGNGVLTGGDSSRPLTPTDETSVLYGVPLYAGPVCVLFNNDVLGFAFDVGYINAHGTVVLKVYARDGTLLGTWGDETSPAGTPGIYTAAWDSSGRFEAFCILGGATPVIAGFSVTNTDSPGVAIRNLRATSTPVLA